MTRLQVRVPVKAGLRQVTATIVKSDDLEAEGLGPDCAPDLEPRVHATSRTTR